MDKNNKLYLTKDEFLQDPLIHEVSNDGRIKRIKIKSSNSKTSHAFRENIKKEENASFPKELTAGFWIRFLAFCFDSIIASCLGKIFIDGPLNLLNISLDSKYYLLLLTLVTILYFSISNLATGGQSLGKMVFGLKVVRMDGKPLDFFTIFIREFVGRFIHSFSFLNLLYVITGFTKYKQNLSDFFADTTVVDESKVEIYQRAYS